MESVLKTILLAVIVGALSGALVTIIILNQSHTTQNLIKDFYLTENAVGLSPQDFISSMNNGNNNMLLVDLRSNGEYNASHMVTAINIPAVSMNAKQIVAAFSSLPKNQTIITHCYSSYCMLSVSVGNLLAENGIYVKHLTVGWLEIKRDYPTYIVYGSQPGVFPVTKVNSTICSVDNPFGC